MAPADHPAGKWRVPLILLRSLQVAISAVSCILGVLMLLGAFAGAQALVVFAVVYLLFASASLVCTTIFLTYTVSPKRRQASCGGNRRACVRWGCDLGWDSFWAGLWAIETGLAIYVAVKSRRGVAWVDVIMSLGMFALYLSTAVMTSKVRKGLQERASHDIEAAKGGMAGADVGKPCTTAPAAVRVA